MPGPSQATRMRVRRVENKVAGRTVQRLLPRSPRHGPPRLPVRDICKLIRLQQGDRCRGLDESKLDDGPLLLGE